MKLKFFDWEVFPDWWCVVVSDEEDHYQSSAYNYKFTKQEENTIKSKMRVYSSDQGKEGILALMRDVSTGVLTGYNSKRYDMVMQRCISMHFTPRQMYIANQVLLEKTHEIPADMEVTQTEIMRIANYVKGYNAKWQGAEASQDLMDDSDGGLKNKEAAYGMDIRETTVPFGKRNLTDTDKDEIIYYCKHDVYALHVHYAVVAKSYIDTKLDLGGMYDYSPKVCYESTNAVLVGKVLGAQRVSGTTIVDPTIVIYEQPLREYIERWVPKEALTHLYTSQRAKQMVMFGNKVSMADGGIHSTIVLPKVNGETPGIYAEATEEYGLFNIDLSGCHPSVMAFAGAMSRGVTKPERFIATILERRRLKKIPKSQWTPAETRAVRGAKLQHNTTYGAMGNKYLPLYDDYMRSKVCRVSQMIIIAVCMEIFTKIPNVKILQTNTDGILTYMKREYLDQLKSIVKNFEDLSNFEFELEEDSKIWQPNVNNYIALDPKGKDKLKGKSFITSIYQPGYNKVRPLGNHIIAEAQYQFYVNKTNPLMILLEHNVVNDFVLTATKGNTYFGMVHETANGDIPLGKVARVIAVTNPELGEVRKLKYKKDSTVVARDLVANCPPNALIVNDALDNYEISGPYNKRIITNKVTGQSYELDLAYYARLLNRAIDIPWYKLKGDKLELTEEFGLGGL